MEVGERCGISPRMRALLPHPEVSGRVPRGSLQPGDSGQCWTRAWEASG